MMPPPATQSSNHDSVSSDIRAALAWSRPDSRLSTAQMSSKDSSCQQPFAHLDELDDDDDAADDDLLFASQEVGKRPALLARNAKNERRDALHDIVAFLQENEPTVRATQPSEPSSHHRTVSASTSTTPQRKLLKRVIKVARRKPQRTAMPSDLALKKRSASHSRSIASSAQRVSNGGHKYIQIVPIGRPSTSSRHFEVEANEARSSSFSKPAASDAVPVTPPSTAREEPHPEPKADSPHLHRPVSKIGGAESTPWNARNLKSIVSQFEAGVSKRRHNGGSNISRTKTNPVPSNLASPLRLDTVTKPSNSSMQSPDPLTPPDSDISAVLRATAPSSKDSRPSTILISSPSNSMDDEPSPNPRKALSSHPTASRGPPPNIPLPETPASRPLSLVESESSLRLGRRLSGAYQMSPDGVLVRPVFVSKAEVPSNSTSTLQLRTRSRSQQSLARYSTPTAAPSLMSSKSSVSSIPIEVPMSSEGRRQSTTATLPSVAEKSHDETTKRPGTSGTMQSASNISTVSTGSKKVTPGSREERIRSRKLRHLQVVRPQPPPTPQASPQEARCSDDLATQSHHATSNELALSVVVATINQAPIAPKRSSAQRFSTALKPAPLRLPLINHYNNLAQRSAPATFNTTFGSPQTRPATSNSARRPPPLHLNPGMAQRSPDIIRDSFGMGFPLPSRLSYVSSADAGLSRDTTVPQTAPAHTTTFNFPGRCTSLTSQSSSSYPASTTKSQPGKSTRSTMKDHIKHLERQNLLLEAALMAVLKTGGLLNGCPCQAEKRLSRHDAAMQRYTHYAPLAGSKDASMRESVLSDAAEQALALAAIGAQSQEQDDSTTGFNRRLSNSTTSSTSTATWRHSQTSSGNHRISANTGASRECSLKTARSATKKESLALALYRATRLDMGAQMTALVDSGQNDGGKQTSDAREVVETTSQAQS